jgi:hypothetical protein
MSQAAVLAVRTRRVLLVVIAALLMLPGALLTRHGAAGATEAGPDPAGAQTGGVSTTVYYPPDVVGQFNALSERAEALGFGIGDSPDPLNCRHYQGVARSTGVGDPFLFVTHNGNDNWKSCPFRHDYPGALLVVDMASRPDDGERLRSNRIRRDTSTVDTPPPASDTTVAVVRFDGKGVWPPYHHPGGVQMVGDVLVVPLEGPCRTEDCVVPENLPEHQILFVDVSNPTNPRPLSTFVPGTLEDFSPGLVGVTRQPGGRYLMLATGKANTVLRFYRSLPTEPDGSTDLADPALQWEHVFDYHKSAIEEDIDRDWPGGEVFGQLPAAYQTMNFVRQGGPTGPLFVIAARNTDGVGAGRDELDLYRVIEGQHEFRFEFVGNRHLVALPTAAASSFGQGDIANFAAASGIYVSPSGDLLLYATEHDNDGPEVGGKGTVKAGEWRHHDMVRPGSPSTHMTASANGPYTVAEGGTVALHGTSAPPVSRAWVELFANDDHTNRSVVIDYPDRFLDDFDDFGEIEANEGDLNGFSDDAHSIRWFAPHGCTIRLNQHDVRDDDFPGDKSKTLHGDGQVHAWNLDRTMNDKGTDDIGGELSSITWFSDCETVYDAPTTYAWDLDGDQIFGETGETGPNPNYSVSNVDGPATRTAYLFACKSGQCRDVETNISITNANPVISSVTNNGPVGEGLAATVTVAATDPGGPGDVLTYSFDCNNDGTYDLGPQSQNSATCAFPDEGTYTVPVKVADDDGGSTTGTTAVAVTNVAPIVFSLVGPTDPVRLGAETTILATFTDPGAEDTHTCTFTWDDGTAPTTVGSGTTGSRECRANHTYAAAGVYRVGLTVSDGDGATSAPAAYEFVVVFNPAGGFVTGAGAIISPAGAYTPDPSVTGRANFAFVSDYRQGANTPSGTTQFRFKSADLVVESVAYQWLVVAGTKAQYKGTARLNGEGGYGFLLTATDDGKSDRFRLKVWDIASGSVVYDNSRGASDDLDAANPQVIETGNITIHKG